MEVKKIKDLRPHELESLENLMAPYIQAIVGNIMRSTKQAFQIYNLSVADSTAEELTRVFAVLTEPLNDEEAEEFLVKCVSQALVLRQHMRKLDDLKKKRGLS